MVKDLARERGREEREGEGILKISRYAVTACETDHYILVVFVMMSAALHEEIMLLRSAVSD